MCCGLVAAQSAADFDAAGAFDHPVEHDKVWHVFGGKQQRFIAIASDIDIVTFGLETKFKQFGEGWVVLDQ